MTRYDKGMSSWILWYVAFALLAAPMNAYLCPRDVPWKDLPSKTKKNLLLGNLLLSPLWPLSIPFLMFERFFADQVKREVDNIRSRTDA